MTVLPLRRTVGLSAGRRRRGPRRFRCACKGARPAPVRRSPPADSERTRRRSRPRGRRQGEPSAGPTTDTSVPPARMMLAERLGRRRRSDIARRTHYRRGRRDEMVADRDSARTPTSA